MMRLLDIESLVAGYGKLLVLRDVSLWMDEGEIVALIGANGAGKSTLLRAVSGLIPAVSGVVRYKNTVISGLKPHAVARRGIAHVPEGRGVFGNLTVMENLQIALFAAGKEGRPLSGRRLSAVFDLFPVLGERRTQRAATLSGGEQQMLAIGRAIVADGELLVLDEPSMGLSPKFVKNVFAVLAELNKKGKSILLVEQNATMALQISRRAYVMENGRITAQGASSDIAGDEILRRSYLGS
jgi:branched-chain amino acid transport system ATP-binding protein